MLTPINKMLSRVVVIKYESNITFLMSDYVFDPRSSYSKLNEKLFNLDATGLYKTCYEFNYKIQQQLKRDVNTSS